MSLFNELNSEDDKLDNSKNDDIFPIVGIGASAGGLEALEQFFKNIKPDIGLAFVVIQHLSPDYKSLMAELLSKHTEMQIFRAIDGISIQKNCIYLIPPKKNMTIFHRKLYLTEQNHSLGLNLPIDIFFRSLAEDIGELSIGIILSGTGSDGTLGIRAIKGAGGLVIVQDELSAKFDGMPKSAIATGMVDYILPPNQMGEQLIKFLSHPLAVPNETKDEVFSKDDDILTKILATIRSRSGVDFTYYKPNTIVRRIERRISVHQIENIQDYYRLLTDSTNEANILYKDLLIGVTKFFRDFEAFSILQERVIPEIFKKKVASDGVRVWAAGCSTGEEAYSLAILFREYMENNGISNDVKIFATDIDKDSIESASIGLYPESIIADVSEERLKKYFIKNGTTFKVNDSIRQMVIFATHNLIKDPPFSKIDLISCRNMLIYLLPVMQKKVISSFSFSLNSFGFLFLGSSESIGELSHYFSVVDNKWKIYRNHEGIKQSIIDDLYVPILRSKTANHLKDLKTPVKSTESELIENINKSLFDEYVPPSIIINEAFDLIHISKDANKFLRIPSGKINLNILNMVNSELSIAIGTAIHRVMKDSKELIYKNISVNINNSMVYIDLVVKPFKSDKTKSTLIAIIFNEIRNEKAAGSDSVMFDMESNANQRIVDLESDLKYTKESLQATIEELETSNEELQATNEELIASNEELQSTNEELQSVNEELYTVNSEYQNKIEELTELNNDINNWFNVANIGTIFLDLRLRIRKFTPSTKEFINLIENDIGRPINHISNNFDYTDFFKDIESVLRTLKPKEKELGTKDSRSVLVKILPYRTIENAIKGIVITFFDISNLKEYEQKIKQDHELLMTVFENSPTGEMMIDENGNITYFNKRITEITGIDILDLKNININKTILFNDEYFQDKESKTFIELLNQKRNVIDDYKVKINTINNKTKCLSIIISPIYKMDDQIKGAVLSVSEIRHL